MSAAMDRPIVQPWWRTKRPKGAAVALGILLLVGSSAVLLLGHAERSVRVAATSVILTKVTQGIFHDFIPIRGKVVPRETIYLDALEGGRVDKVLVEPGDVVSHGQSLIVLSNTELELSVRERVARLIDSITQLQTYQTQLEQNHLNNEKELQRIDYNIARLRNLLERHEALVTRGLEARELKDNVQEELNYNLKLRPLQAQSNQRQENLRAQQVPQIKSQIKKLQEDIEVTHGKLENLIVRAPVAGRLTAIDLKIGENRNRGERLAEITPGTGYKLSADIDEFYLGRLKKSQTATVEIANQHSTLQITRIYPQVKEGTFRVELAFVGAPPAGLLSGQAVQGKLALGQDAPGLILSNGPFFGKTGGDWVFVLNPDGRTAYRRHITVGRRNADQLEIIDGLQVGEQVITSDYTGLERTERVDLTK